MEKSSQTPESTPQPSAAKKDYHWPDLRDFGTVKELTLTGGINGPQDSILQLDYATGGGNGINN